LLAALAAAVRRAGAFPELNVTSDELQMELMTTVPIEHLRTVPPHRLRWLEDVDAMIVTDSVADPYRAADVSEERRRAAHAAAGATWHGLRPRRRRICWFPARNGGTCTGGPWTSSTLGWRPTPPWRPRGCRMPTRCGL